MNATIPVTARPMRQAATLIVLRDGAAGMEVLLLRRVERSDDRSSGAWVFPGGTLDKEDGRHLLCTGMDDAQASERLALPKGGLDLHIAAVRECFEESGLLLAYGPDGALLSDGVAIRELWHQQQDIGAVCASLNATLAVDRLAYAAHWVTPPGLPKRFDTRFFVAIAPPGQEVVHGPQEITEHRWITPQAALAAPEQVLLMMVTRRVLQSVAGFVSAQDCVNHFRGLLRIPQVRPMRAVGHTGPRTVLPWEAPYAEIEHLDANGRGDAWCDLRPFVPVRLTARLWRIPGEKDNAYLLRFTSGECVLIDPQAPFETLLQALRDAGLGPIRCVLSTGTHSEAAVNAAKFAEHAGVTLLMTGDKNRLDFDDGTSLEIVDAMDSRWFFVKQERVLFTSEGTFQGPPGEGPEPGEILRHCEREWGVTPRWLAPARGFLVAC